MDGLAEPVGISKTDAEAAGNDAEARAALSEFVDGLVHAQRREHGLAALTVSVVRDDELWLTRGYGLADLEAERRVQADRTLFRIGSVSKTFTWTALMMLSERGALDLDADVNEYLEGFRVEEAFGEPVTLRHLMHHRAGFENSIRFFTVADDDPRSLSELLAEHQPERIYPPGERTSYSNWGAALAAHVVETASGRPFRDYLRDEILEPLDMNETTWLAPMHMDEELRNRLAAGYRPRKGALGPQDYMQLGAYWPVGGMASTATDMARWMRFHLNGGALDGVRLMTAGTHERMWTRAFDDRPDATDIAHGFQDRPYRGTRTLGHAGGTAAFLTNMVLVPELRLGVFLSQNGPHSRSPINQLPDLLIDRFIDHEHRPDLVGETEGNAGPLAELSGTYLNNRRVFSSFAALFGAMNAAELVPDSDRGVVLSTSEETRYYHRMGAGNDVFEAANGGRIAVIRDRDGNVVALADDTGVHTWERVGVLEAPNTLFISLGAAVLLALTTSLGGWRRFGLGLSTGLAYRIAGAAAFFGVLAVIALAASIGALAIGLADLDLSRMHEIYPAAGMFYTHYAGWAVALVSGLMVLAHWPAWTRAGWGVWRRLHFGVFTLAMLFLTFQLWHWRVIGAPVH